MSYLGRATDIKLETKLNGTHTLTFQLPDKYFDSEKGEYVRNEFVDSLFNERKIKLKFMGQWYEFYIKSVNDTKHFKSYMKKYNCTDAFIDELSRNGYGITFDTELYNNVEEVGTFSRIILEDSIWSYAPEYNWGDFTEYLEEKLFKIPVGGDIFPEFVGHKLFYNINAPREEECIINAFTGEKRAMELGDDLAAAQDGKGGYFWDSQDGTMPLIGEPMTNIPNDGYIYIPYSQLQFCYKTTSTDVDEAKVYAATEEVQYYDDKSYAIAPLTVDPTALIQFIAIPPDEKVEIDESGLLLNKDYTYVMTVEEWNTYIDSHYYYKFLPEHNNGAKEFILTNTFDYEMASMGNMAAYYDGYLDRIGDVEVINGKKISITDRTEINITDEIDQYVTVYNQKFDNDDLKDLYVNPDNNWKEDSEINYRVCSKIDTRQIVPQLARNYIQNGTKIKTTDGWEPQAIYDDDNSHKYSVLKTQCGTYQLSDDNTADYITAPQEVYLKVMPVADENNQPPLDEDQNVLTSYNTLINFGIVGQEKKIYSNQIYCLGLRFGVKLIDGRPADSLFPFKIQIGEGAVKTQGEYDIKNPITIDISEIVDVHNLEVIEVIEKENNEDVSVSVAIAEGYVLIRFSDNIENPYFAIVNQGYDNTVSDYYVFNAYFFEAYTKGIDQFDDDGLEYRYSGREVFNINFKDNLLYTDSITKDAIHKKILFEDDIMPGDVYEYQKYFIQQVVAYETDQETGIRTGKSAIADTFAQKSILSDYGEDINFKNTNVSHHDLPYSAAQFSNDDLEISTKYIDLTKCKYYNTQAKINEPDCSCGGKHICLYQKYGYCPYMFTSEKHCRKVRTLNGEKSNRFNLTQELSKVFEIYPIYWTEHYDNGKIVTDTVRASEEEEAILGKTHYEKMRKKLFYIKEKGMENKLGFRYEKNLSNISRDIKSDQIVTKLYVSDVDSDLSKTGLCSIKTAEDNPSKDSFVINFDYYTTKGILDKSSVDADLYGKGEGDQGYLKQLGHLNTEYDKLSNLIINLQNASFNELQANVNVNTNGIEAAQQQLYKIKKQIDRYKAVNEDEEVAKEQNKENKTYQNQIDKYNEQLNILNNLIFETFFDQVTEDYIDIKTGEKKNGHAAVTTFFDNMTLKEMQDSPWFKQHIYNLGMLGQYNREYLQITEWKKQQAYYLKEINKLSLRFFRKYEPYLKEGTWSDSNYLSDNAYYFGAVQVAAEGAIPKVSYNISVIDLYALPEYEDYLFNIADTTYVEDIGMFGINPITGLPNRLKVLISGITYDLDEPSNNSIQVQNFTTQFADLFQQVTATVQSLSFNENIYKRASNFTSNQNINSESLQGTLDTNEMKLINTDESNIKIDKEGQSGSDINNHNNKYKLAGQGMAFSTNGGQTWDVGVGPGGINADYINTGTLDAGKIRIVDNNYLYFFWDTNGITAFREPQAANNNISFNDYALFNRYGLSLVEDGKIRLRAGYSFNGDSGGTTGGKINTETSQGEDIGFYLYNMHGAPIFSTSTASSDLDAEDMTARITLKGEMYVSDNVEGWAISDTTYFYNFSYRFNPLDTILIGNIVTPIAHDTDYLHITLTDFDQEICANYLNYHLLNGDIPMNNDWDINPLVVTVDTDTYEIKVSALYPSTISTYVKNDEYYFDSALESLSIDSAYDAPSVPGQSPIKIIKKSLEYVKENNNIYDYSQITITYCSKENIKETDQIYLKSPLSLTNSKKGYIYEENEGAAVNPLPITSLENFYYEGNDNFGYINQKIDEDEHPATIGPIGLYINNKKSWGDAQLNNDQRLFCCARTDNDKTQNLFTIKKNGSLYMGGFIENIDGTSPSSENVGDEIQVKDADIFIEQGVMWIDFTKMKDPATEMDLVSAIASAVAGAKLISHNHAINVIQGSFDNSAERFAFLPTLEDLTAKIAVLGITENNVLEYIIAHPNVGWMLLAQGEYTISGSAGAQKTIYFTNKIPIAGENYIFNCINTHTANAGSASGGGGGATFTNWGYRNIVE